MHYLCLVYGQEPDHPDRDSEAETHALVDALAESGYQIAAYSLAAPEHATSLRVTGDGLVLTDGPATDEALPLRRVIVLEARDLNEAIRMASWLPDAQFTTIEIRPVHDPPRVETSPDTGAGHPASPAAADEPVSVV